MYVGPKSTQWQSITLKSASQRMSIIIACNNMNGIEMDIHENYNIHAFQSMRYEVVAHEESAFGSLTLRFLTNVSRYFNHSWRWNFICVKLIYEFLIILNIFMRVQNKMDIIKISTGQLTSISFLFFLLLLSLVLNASNPIFVYTSIPIYLFLFSCFLVSLPSQN